MGGRLNFTLEQASHFDLDSIPEADEDDTEIDFVEDDSLDTDVDGLEFDLDEITPLETEHDAPLDPKE